MNYYIHLPFCKSKCGYCAFYSESGASESLIDAFLEHLEMEFAATELPPPETIYLGGGTPTLLSTGKLQKLFAMIGKYLAPNGSCEISIEANPETLDREKVALIRDHTTRISLGVQSFSAEIRKTLGRNCGDHALENAITLIRKANFNNWNIDLIYGVPGETEDLWKNDLRLAAEYGADHISCYSLTPEENSRLGASFVIDDDCACDMYDLIPEALAPFGIQRYEISNYAKLNSQCRHNVNVWRGGVLRGFGPAAAGFDGVDRMTNAANLKEWLNGTPPETDHIPQNERLNEIFVVNLRTVNGWSPECWAAVPGADSWQERLTLASKTAENMPQSWWKISPECIKLSSDGLCFWNTVAEMIFK